MKKGSGNRIVREIVLNDTKVNRMHFIIHIKNDITIFLITDK